MRSDPILALTQQMYQAHGAFSDTVAACRMARSNHAPADVQSHAILDYLVAAEQFDRAISALLHHLHSLVRANGSDAAAEQAQQFRNMLHTELNVLAQEQA